MRRLQIVIAAIVLVFAGRCGLAVLHGKGLTAVEAAQLASASVSEPGDADTVDSAVIVDRLEDTFADHRPRFRGNDGAPFSPIARSGVWVRDARVERDTVRITLAYADARAGSYGDIYCIFVDVAQHGAAAWLTAEARFDEPDACPGQQRNSPRGPTPSWQPVPADPGAQS